MAGAHLRRPPPDLRALRSDLPGWLADALERCLARTSAHRPGTVELAKLLLHPSESIPQSGPLGALGGFLKELKQRKVYRAAVAYAAVFVILQAADLMFPVITQSEVPYRLMGYASLAGFPVAIVLAWLFDLRHGRLVRTHTSCVRQA